MKSKTNSNEYNEFLDHLSGYYLDKEKTDAMVPVGERLKNIREMQGFTIERLAQLTGLEPGYLEKVESQVLYPDLGVIIKLSKALSIAAGLLLGEKSGYGYSVVRKEARQKIKRFTTGTRERPNYHYQSLASGVVDRHMESFIVTLDPDTGGGHELSSHEGEEFIVVMEGEIQVTLGNKDERLGEGDSIYYLSSIPHVVRNTTKSLAVILAVIYTG